MGVANKRILLGKQVLLQIGIWCLVLGFTTGCKKDRFLFDIPLPTMAFDLPGGLNPIETHYFNIQGVPTFIDTILAAQGFSSIDEASEIIPKEARLFNFDGIRYDWIFDISVRICPEGDFEPNCGIEVFYRAPVPENEDDAMDLWALNGDVTEYVKRRRVNFQVKLVTLRTFSPGSQRARLQVEFQAR